MEEDINFLKSMIKEYKIFGDLHNPDFENIGKICQSIENLINKNKELENMVDEMASFIEVAELDEDIAKTYCKNETCTDINSFNCKKCIIEYFKKKASEENA